MQYLTLNIFLLTSFQVCSVDAVGNMKINGALVPRSLKFV